jgi:putative membrane protein
MIAVLRWTDWYWDPMIMSGLVLGALLYIWALRRFPARGRQAVFFWAGFGILIIALLSPLHTGATYLFTLHMVQHMLLMLAAPPLLALGMPPGLLGWVYRHGRARRIYQAVWSPLPAFALYNGVLLVWHLPTAYDATLRSYWVHASEHLSFVAAGLVFWGVIVAPSPRLGRASFGIRIAMVIGADIIGFVVSFALAFANRPLYPAYTIVPRLWGLSPLNDLRLGGAVMWVMGQMMYAAALLILLYWMLRREEGGGEALGAPAPAR